MKGIIGRLKKLKRIKPFKGKPRGKKDRIWMIIKSKTDL